MICMNLLQKRRELEVDNFIYHEYLARTINISQISNYVEFPFKMYFFKAV